MTATVSHPADAYTIAIDPQGKAKGTLRIVRRFFMAETIAVITVHFDYNGKTYSETLRVADVEFPEAPAPAAPAMVPQPVQQAQADATPATEPRTLAHGELVRLAGWNHVTFAKVGTIEGYTLECGGDVPKALERVHSLRQDLAWVGYSGGALVDDGGHYHREQQRKAAEATTIAHGDLVTLEGRAYRVLVLPRCEAFPVFSDPIKFEPV